jgi:cyclopropane-fatty-acyl-phospholipid synthase
MSPVGETAMLLAKVLSRVIREGQLIIIDAAGGRHVVQGPSEGPAVTMRVHDRRTEWRLVLRPRLALGEGYMDGKVTVEDGDVHALLDLLGRNMAAVDSTAMMRWSYSLQRAVRAIQHYNPIGKAQKNVAHHYDLSDELYDSFLDGDRQYSCAYFRSPTDSLEQAQLNKKRHIASKLLLRPGQQVLDIGSGWGGMGLYLAEIAGAQVTGVTLSEEQLALSRVRADEKGLAGRVAFRLQDYRDIAERFDRIVSVGMFEHVGVVHFDVFFRKCADVLSDDGVMLLHAIGRSEGPGVTNPWINKYIFPGGYIPALSEVLPAVERAGFLVNDIEILRLHYAETLKHWRERFLAHREDLPKTYDERFVRMWEFYLAASEMAFREQNLMVFQLQLTKRQGVVPITRDYIAREEARLRGLESGSRPPLRLAGE